ncbi:restriction endonuclease [Spiribacter halobius]|uniref:Restriction endonuclease n=1 Tax=Sediminicurvatus halobius TaxID=2182432 RepID=A0A2U2MWW1_9GAMM|nr:restriction endonuclease [Spiribacter halobius]
MAKAVFTTAAGSVYDDLPEFRYHFPRTYLGAVRRAIGDWVVYYEPRRTEGPASSAGRQAYFAVARITGVEPDSERSNHFYAFVRDYLEFDRAVPFREGERYYESVLRRPDGGTSKGAFGRSVRLLPEEEFRLIVQAGFAEALRRWEAEQIGEAPAEYHRHPIHEQLVRRPFRDVAFRRHVREAYDNRCAITGLRLTNGGGRPEVQAAHIRPVAKEGPDSVRNGLALTSTVHWLFDRGLITIDDDHCVRLSGQGMPDGLERLLAGERSLVLPERPELRPHPMFVRWHREHVFKP